MIHIRNTELENDLGFNCGSLEIIAFSCNFGSKTGLGGNFAEVERTDDLMGIRIRAIAAISGLRDDRFEDQSSSSTSSATFSVLRKIAGR